MTHSLSNHSLLTHYSLTTHSLGGLGVAGSPGVEPTTPSIRARFWYHFTGSRTYDPLDPGSILVPLYRESNLRPPRSGLDSGTTLPEVEPKPCGRNVFEESERVPERIRTR